MAVTPSSIIPKAVAFDSGRRKSWTRRRGPKVLPKIVQEVRATEDSPMPAEGVLREERRAEETHQKASDAELLGHWGEKGVQSAVGAG